MPVTQACHCSLARSLGCLASFQGRPDSPRVPRQMSWVALGTWGRRRAEVWDRKAESGDSCRPFLLVPSHGKAWLAQPPRTRPGSPWQGRPCGHGPSPGLAVLSHKYFAPLASSETQLGRLQMVPPTDGSQEPRQMDLSQGSVKLEDDLGKVPLRFPVTTSRTAQHTAPHSPSCHRDTIVWGVAGNMAEN